MDSGSLRTCPSKRSASPLLARANGTNTRLAAQVEITPSRTASCSGSDNAESSARRRFTQLGSLPTHSAKARWLIPSATIAESSQACSIGSNGRAW